MTKENKVPLPERIKEVVIKLFQKIPLQELPPEEKWARTLYPRLYDRDTLKPRTRRQEE